MKSFLINPLSGELIDYVWEVNIDRYLWQRVKKVAVDSDMTYSQVSRSALFMLYTDYFQKGVNLHSEERRELRKVHQPEHKEYLKTVKRHRHVVCLYGKDEHLIRLMALQLGITVSALIRLALRMYLERVLENKKNGLNYRITEVFAVKTRHSTIYGIPYIWRIVWNDNRKPTSAPDPPHQSAP